MSSVSSVSSATNAASVGTTTYTNTDANAGKSTLGVTDFLKLLSTQMQAQDPLNPTDDTQMIAQMASFTSLQQMSDLSTTMSNYTTTSAATNATSYLGKNVTLLSNGQSVSGTVTGVDLSSGTPMITVGGKSYDPSTITAIQQPTAATTSTSTTTGS